VYRALAALKGPHIFPKSVKAGGIDPLDSWTHAVMSAIGAQMMAEDRGEESGFLFTTGLLHDLGKSILGETADYAAVVRQARAEHKPLHEVEKSVLGTDHATVGARLLERWNFSPEMVASVRFHHQPELAGTWERFAAIIQVASAASHKKHPDRGQRSLVFEATSGLRLLDWRMEDLERYSERLNENEALARAMLRMGGA
jgi:putative nucleotidyltransferase with HDIG domain